ncbi:hypothetical protein N7532_005350 [Penicillium argentinense]|uniref:Thioredoxin domain-containing protein n=1 Tax=Penicillium argentinense TaxID=1131581 RepID=A0A9W9FDW4_9EURO|nr:uncharacterized protein N7532_005350 [Penicillium argentinense]KAJ5098349.1 hypothetical protein N7532_005350 [Penicillium argentinense]
MAGGNVVEITSKEQWVSDVLNASDPVLIEKLSNEYTGIKFFKVDVDKLGEVAAENSISAMPTFLFFKGGEKIETVRGANPPAIQAGIQKLL